MAVVYNPDANSPSLAMHGQSGSYYEQYYYRHIPASAKTKPSPDPTSPHNNNLWKIQTAQKTWENLKQCQKDWYNHSFKKRKLVTADPKQAHFMQSGYYLGVNVALYTLDPKTGTYFVPDCYCYAIINPDWTPSLPTWAFTYVAKSENAYTAYFTNGNGNTKLIGAEDPACVQGECSLATHVHMTRYSWGLDDVAPEYRPIALTNWFPLHLKSWFEDVAMWDEYRWKYVTCKKPGANQEDCMIAHFYKKTTLPELCYESDMQFTFKFSDAGLKLSWEGGTTGTKWDIYFGDEKIGEIWSNKDDGSDGGSYSYGGHPFSEKKWKYPFLRYAIPPIEGGVGNYIDVHCDMIDRYNEHPCGGSDGFWYKYYHFKLDREIFCGSWGPHAGVRVDTEMPIYDDSGWGWSYPWGTAQMIVRGPSNPDWTYMWAYHGLRDGVRFSGGNKQHCDLTGWGAPGWFNECLLRVKAAGLMPACVHTKVTGLTFRVDKNYLRGMGGID